MATAHPPSAQAPLPGTVRALSAPAVAVLVLGGGWVAGGVVTNDFQLAMLLTAVWVGAVGLACLLLFLRRREMWPALAAFVVTAGAAGVYLATETLVDDRVSEDVVTAAPAGGDGGGADGDREQRGVGGAQANVLVASGGFSSLEHTTSGDAELIDIAGSGTVLTMTDFETDPGPDLRLYLSSADAGTGSAGEQYVDLGALKGNVGDQQYEVPPDADLDRLTKVLVWCRAFSVGFGEAQLEPARGDGRGTARAAA